MLALTYCFACIRGGHRDPAWRSKLRMLGPCWLIFRSWASFLPIRNALRILLRKNEAKSAKIEDLGLPKPLQNPSKTPPKSRFEKTSLFASIFAGFSLLTAKAEPQNSCAQPVFCWLFAHFGLSLLACIFGAKNIPKTLPKPRPSPSKIDVKNALFFNIDFWGFGPWFWRVWGLQLGAKLALCSHIFRSWTRLGRLLGTFCAICCVQERFGLDFGWIWTPQTYVLEAQTLYFSMVFVDNALIAAGNPGLHFLWLFVLPLQRGGTCAAHRIGAELDI